MVHFAGLVVLLVGLLVGSPAFSSDLAGTAWYLVKIMSMDDTVKIPDEGMRYTLEFNENGLASIRADCNRGSGTWRSESSGRLRFGPIASTRALCPPESLSGEYLGHLENVRSYIFEEGHLFLATRADGAIIEFAPVRERR